VKALRDEGADKFIAMVTATAQTDLRLSDFAPRSVLEVPATRVARARFAAVDFHNHLDALGPSDVLRVMDACNVEQIVNITMREDVEEAAEVIERFRRAAPGRFHTVAWMDWRDLHEPGFFARAVGRLDRLARAGACGLKIWKDLGLRLRDSAGRLLRVDDERLAPLFERAADLGVFVMFHTADPEAFFRPVDRFNERYEELSAHPDWSFHGSEFTKAELLGQRNRVFARHPRTTFVGAHAAERPESLAEVARWLDEHPNFHIDISARTAELGRQPYTAREFFVRHADRILFGTDLVPEEEMYRLHFRFLETADEYFDYPSHASRQGRWQIYGLHLPDEVLRAVYRENALRLLGSRSR
jgi:predicted TIM-barrel fold metal-dependent hydrolase